MVEVKVGDEDGIEVGESMVCGKSGKVGEAACVCEGGMSAAIEKEGIGGSGNVDATATDVAPGAEDVEGELRR